MVLMAALQVAQAAPSIHIDAFVFDVGHTVELRAEGVQAHAVYTITVSPETGEAMQYREQSDATGAFDFSFVPDTAGNWEVQLFGTSLTTSVTITAIDLPPVVSEPLHATLSNRTLTIVDPYGDGFSHTFPTGAGPVTTPLVHGNTVLIGVGNHVLHIHEGVITQRSRLPAVVTDVLAGGDGELHASIEYSNGSKRTLVEAEWTESFAFDPQPLTYSYLRNEAQVVDIQAGYETDPTNPFVWLAAARDAGDEARADMFYANALDSAETFYEYGQLSRALYADGENTFAMQAMNRAIRDFDARGYDAALMGNDALTDLYGFPQTALRDALASNNLEAATFWAPFMQQLTTPAASHHRAVFTEYAAALQDAGETERANDVRAFMGQETRFDISVFLADMMRTLAQNTWIAVVGMLTAALLLALTLSAKYSAIRRLHKADTKQQRYFFLRYASFFEKIVLVILLGLAVSFAALSEWQNKSTAVVAIASGSLATPVATATLPANTNIENITTLHQLENAVNGSWTNAITTAFTSPAAVLQDPAFGIATWAWYIIVIVFAIIALVATVFIVIPRPRVAKNVPRNPLYVVLALLVPGVSFTDELWGIVFLAPWSVLMLDRVIGLAGGATFVPELWSYVVIGLLYVLNVLLFIPEVFSHRRRMKELAERDPELARRLGVRVA